jgi:branched-chain amino acid transport system ATP-binding protein
MDLVFELFPALKGKRNSTAGYLSGGEQQMVVVGRALMASPKLMLLDEPSLGIGPILVQEIFNNLKAINKEKNIGMLLVEQNAQIALSISQQGYVIENGRIVLQGKAEELRDNEDIKEFYMGMSLTGQRKRYRDVKHYKWRKRWLG